MCLNERWTFCSATKRHNDSQNQQSQEFGLSFFVPFCGHIHLLHSLVATWVFPIDLKVVPFWTPVPPHSEETIP
jgi:hypothetical protein